MRLSSPGPYDDAKKKGGVVGALEEFVYLRRNGNGVDGALASVLKLCAPVDLAIPEVGEISGSYTGSIGEVVGLKVYKTARTTGHTWGKVENVAVNLPIDYGEEGKPRRVLRFERVLEIVGAKGKPVQ